MALVVLDAGVVIALRVAADAHHQMVVPALASFPGGTFVLPASAYAETLVEPARHGAAAIRAARRLVQAIPIRVEPISAEIAERAAVLRRHVRLPDALVIATGEVLGADVVLTTDKRWQALSPRVRVVA